MRSDSRTSSNIVDDAEDFYVFVYDEEDKTNTQARFGKGGRRMERANKTRVLAFWCFNAGVGFK